MDHRDRVIERLAPGKTFAEVGGLWGLTNEKVSVPHAAGATDLCMIDIWSPQDEWWLKFRQHCSEKSIGYVREIIGSIDNPDVIRQAGLYDVVHCSGVLYHCPNPFHTIANLIAITSETLVIGAAVMPPKIVNEAGTVSFGRDAAICVPFLTDENRRVVDLYIAQSYGGGAWGVNDPVDNWFFSQGEPNYGPWCWLWSADYLRGMLKAAGLDIVEDFEQFGGTGHLFVCSKRQQLQKNYGLY